MSANDNAGIGSIKNHTGTAKGFQSFAAHNSQKIQDIAKQFKEQRLRRDNAALRLPPMYCGCRDPLRCSCLVCGDCLYLICQCEHRDSGE